MNLINSLLWWQWLILAAVPPAIIALYFLKLRRQPLEVPSTYLWQRAIEDLHVNSLWQRLRQNLLLFLQLLVVALVMLACLRPGWRGASLSGDRFVFLIDTSASMSAVDVTPSRLAEAKRRVAEMIQTMQSGDVAMLVSFSDTARVEQPFTDNRRLLLRKLEGVEPTRRTSNLSEALRVASGLANPGRTGDPNNPLDQQVAPPLPATLYILSDGRFDAVPDFSLGNLDPKLLQIGKPTAENLAVTAFSTQRNEEKPDQLEAFAAVQNYSGQDATIEATLYLDGELLDAAQVKVPAGTSGGVDFPLGDLEDGILKLQIAQVGKQGDDLALDDVVYTSVNAPRRSKVLLVTPQNEALVVALETEEARKVAEFTLGEPSLLETAEYRQQADSGAYDLVIYDQCAPKEMPQANTLFIGRLPPLPTAAEPAADAGPVASPDKQQSASSGQKDAADLSSGAAPRIPGLWTAKPTVSVPQVIDVDRAHPLMQFVELGTVRIAEGYSLVIPPGGTSLIEADVGPIFVIAPRQGFEDAVLGFEIVGTDEKTKERYANTDWPIRRSFPLFLMNAVRYLGGGGGNVSAGTVQPGKIIHLRTEAPVQQITVRSPGGESWNLRRDGQSTFPFSQTDELGVYEVREGPKTSQHFSVNLFDPNESNLAPQEINIGGEKIASQSAWQPMRREVWKYLLLAAVGVLLVEWYIFNRRVYI